MKKILMVDDDNDLLAAYQVYLTSKGYEVILANSGQEGFEKLKNEKPDLLVLDVMMDTNFDGYNLMHRIKEEPYYKNLPIILLTGMGQQLGVNLYSGVEDIDMLPNVRFQDKPVEPQTLVELIESLLGQK